LNKKFVLILIAVSYFATFLRLYLNNNFIVSFIGSFLYGFVFSRNISKLRKEILLVGFCSCFTSFSGFVYYLYQLILQGNYLELFFYLNLIIISNLIIMYIGFLLSRKMT
tara:strand:+ start:704 stop:1033 length:330 start_codon:yes stop_codon:yes gene_type:complete